MVRVTATLTFFALLLVATGSAQTARQAVAPCEADPIGALTGEFRGLRAELGDATRASMRLQLGVARLQSQEQRVLHFDREYRDVVRRRAQMENQRDAQASQLKQFDAFKQIADSVTPEERRQINQMLNEQKARLAQLDVSILQLRNEESDAQAALAVEQGRLNDINGRLDDLERSLSR